MHIKSSAFVHNSVIPSLYTCQGEGICPPLEFSEVPPDAMSLVLIIDDPDAVSGIFTHWIIFNIPPHTAYVDNNTVLKEAVHTQFVAPCPPKGTGIHHYHFKLFALNKKLALENKAAVKDIETAMQGNIVAQAELIGLYGE